MKSLGSISRTVTKVTTLALAMRLVAPVGVVCQLSDHETASEQTEHHDSDAHHPEHHDSDVEQHAHHGVDRGQEAPEHPCHDADGNCGCSLTFVPEVQPSRSVESVELRGSSDSGVVMPRLLALVPDVVIHFHLHEVFHPPRSVGVKCAGPTRGPPSLV